MVEYWCVSVIYLNVTMAPRFTLFLTTAVIFGHVSILYNLNFNVLSAALLNREESSKDSWKLDIVQVESTSEKSARSSRGSRLFKYFQTYRYVLPAVRMFDSPVPAKECGKGPDFDAFFKLNYQVRSRMNEDLFIYNTFFKGRNITNNRGTYVEMGAYDGTQESNSHFFDKCLGWKGLLIEGNPGSFQKIVASRPFAHKMNLAPSCSAEYEKENKTIPFYWHPLTNSGLVGKANALAGKPTVDVPCGPLTPILEDVFQNQTIDFFSLDVEGAEPMVLDTLDFSKVRINVMMIEAQNNFCRKQCASRDKVRQRMQQEGYLRYEGLVHASDIYVHPESPYQIPTK